MKYLVVILLPKNISKEVSEIQHKFKPPRWIITAPPHITLLPPGQALADVDQAKKIIGNIVKDFTPFEIKLSAINSFKSVRHTVFLNVKKSQNLSDLHKILIGNSKSFISISKREKDRDYFPHLTLVNRLRDRETPIIKKKLRNLNLNYQFICDSIVLMQKENSQKIWKKCFNIKFD